MAAYRMGCGCGDFDGMRFDKTECYGPADFADG